MGSDRYNGIPEGNGAEAWRGGWRPGRQLRVPVSGAVGGGWASNAARKEGGGQGTCEEGHLVEGVTVPKGEAEGRPSRCPGPRQGMRCSSESELDGRVEAGGMRAAAGRGCGCGALAPEAVGKFMGGGRSKVVVVVPVVVPAWAGHGLVEVSCRSAALRPALKLVPAYRAWLHVFSVLVLRYGARGGARRGLLRVDGVAGQTRCRVAS